VRNPAGHHRHRIAVSGEQSRLIEKIAELVKDKKIEGIAELRDESDKGWMRIYMNCRRGESAEVVLNNLFLHTALQCGFGRQHRWRWWKVSRACSTQAGVAGVLATAARSWCGVPCSSCAKPASVPTSSRGWRWRWPISTADHPDSGRRDPAAARTALLERVWTPGTGYRLAGAHRCGQFAAEDLPVEFG